MKTRNLLFALALPAAFAACSQDEFATEESGVSLAGRKSIGEITLVTDAQTRITAGDNGFEFNNEDALSAALIDRPYPGLAGQHEYAYDNYEITDYISSNYKFEKKGGSWSSKATMVEGNYMFLAPYVSYTGRKPMEATLPAEQNLKLDASGKIDEKSAIQEVLDGKNPVFIGHRFLAADAGTEQGINFYSIYSYPKITVKNSDPLRQPVIVKKVLLKKKLVKDDQTYTGFTLNAPFSNEKVRNALMNEVFAPQGEDTKDQAVMGWYAKAASKNFGVKAGYDGKNTEAGQALPKTLELTTIIDGYGNVVKPDPDAMNQKTGWKGGLTGKTSDLLSDKPSKTGEYIVINFPGDGYKLNYGESVSFNAVVPADEYDMKGDMRPDKKLELYVEVNTNVGETGGEVINVWKKKADSRSNYLTLYPGKFYPDQDYNGTSLRPNKGGYFTILTGKESNGDITGSELVGDTQYDDFGVVTTTEELLAAVKNIHSNIKQVIEVNGKNVKFNKAVNEAIANTDCQQIEIQGMVYIDASDYANKTMTVSDRIYFRDVIVEKGTVIFNGENNKLEQVFVAPKATLKLWNLNTASEAEIYNAGTLNVETKNGLESIFNYSVLNIKADLRNAWIENWKEGCKWDYGHTEIISMPIDLMPSVNVLAGGKYAVSGMIYYPITVAKQVGTKIAELVVNGRTEITSAYASAKGKGNIINNGVISGVDTNTESAVLVVTSGHEMTNNVDAKISVAVEIEGASHTLAELKTNPIDSWMYTKAAKVTNSGTMDKDVVVDGLLVMGASNARVDGTITMTAGEEGEIDNTAKGVLATPLGSTNVPVVFATRNLIDVTTEEALEATKKDMESFIGGTKQVKVFRLYNKGTLKVGNALVQVEGFGGITDLSVGGNDAQNITIEFMTGSSLTIGETTFVSDNKFKVSGKDVVWSGRTDDTSKFGIPVVVKGLHLADYWEGNRYLYTAEEGNVIFNHCEEITKLKK